MDRIGRVPAWAAERLVPAEGQTLPLDQLYQDYDRWCAEAGRVPLREGVFRERFIAVARETGIPFHPDWADTVVLHVALVG